MKITQPLPEWVDRWLKLPYYGKKCAKHPKIHNTVYCGTCNQGPVCTTCWGNISDQHHGDHHQILTVRIASRRACIEIAKIMEFIDVSEIQIYSINDKEIVFLNPPEGGASRSHCKPYCRTCRRRLIKDKYKFCSIACKIRPKEALGDMEMVNKSHDEEKTTIKIKLMINRKIMMINDECSASLRKRSRKGIPGRAPLM